MRVQPTGPVFADSSVHMPYDVCFGKFARRHGYAFGRHGASVIKFCIACTQLLFGRGPTGSFAFKIFRSKNFRPPSLHLYLKLSLPPFLAVSLYFFLSRDNERPPRDNSRREIVEEEKSYRRGKTQLRKSSAESAKLSSAQVTTRRRFCQFSTNWPTARSLARDREGFSWRGQKVSTAKSSQTTVSSQFRIPRDVNAFPASCPWRGN